MSKRITAILLAVMMLFSLMPTMAFAEEEAAVSEEAEVAVDVTEAAEPDTYTSNEDGDVSAEEETGIDADSIENIVFADVEIVEGNNGYLSCDSYWDEELDDWVDSPEYFIYNLPNRDMTITVYYKDGTEETYTDWKFYDVFEVYDYSDQSYENQWGVGEHQFTVIVNGKEYTWNIIITENPVENIVFSDVEIVEGTNGYYDHDSVWDEELEDWVEGPEYFRYDIPNSGVTATVYYKDGTVETYTAWEIFGTFEVFINSDQSYENQWGLGEHQFTFSINNVNYTLNYTITEDPIIEIAVSDIVAFEGCNGYYGTDSIWEEDGNMLDVEFFCYDAFPEEITIKYRDGSEKTYDMQELEREFSDVWFSNDQSYENQWGVGNHTASLYVDGRQVSYNVIVKESPIEKFTVPDIYVVENMQAWITSDLIYDKETGKWIGTPNYGVYDIHCGEITVYFKDGTVVTKNEWQLFEDYGADIYETDDQSYDNQWGIGKHTARFSFMGKTFDANVFIRETPVKNIKASPVVIYEGEHKGPCLKEWCDENGDWHANWYEIYSDYYPEEVTIEFVDGSVYTCSVWMLSSIAGYEYYISDDQDYDNEWGLGKHTATLHFMDATADFEVSIVESPVESIEISDIKTVENHGGYDAGYGYVYDVYNTPITINYKDGTSETYANLYDAEGMTGHSIREDVCYDHETGVSAYPTQSSVNVWEAGTHQVCMEFCGVKDVYNVVIDSESPVESLSVNEPIRILEGVADTVLYTDENGEMQYRYYYNRNPAEITVNYKDGSSATYAWDEIQEKTGYLPVCNCVTDAEKGNWTAGEHITTVEFAGAVCECPVIIEDSGVASIEAGDVTIPAKTDCEIVFHYDLAKDVGVTDYYYYDIAPSEITVTYKDGHVETLDKERLLRDWAEKGNSLMIASGQDAGEYWDVGTYEVSVTYLGKSATYNITITDGCVHSSTETVNVKAASCTEAGYTGDVVCADCGAVISRGRVIPALGHSYTYSVSKAPWEKESGTLTGTCKCGDEVSITLPKLNKTDYTYSVIEEATCMNEGSATYTWNNTQYGVYSFDVTLLKGDGGHNCKPEVVAPTCTKQGYTCYRCEHCNLIIGGYTDYVPALGHNYADGACTRCGAKDPDYKPPVQENPFVDVSETAVYYDAVLWASENGITSGYGNNDFRPQNPCTRAQVVTFLWRAMGSPEPKSSNNPFSDVSAKQANGKDNPYYKAILWAAEEGITTGYAGGLFKPNDTVTRGQFVTFLWRAEGKPATSGSINGFADAAQIASPYQQAVAWAVEKGITTGYEDNTFRPNAACTRWAVVLFMYRDMA